MTSEYRNPSEVELNHIVSFGDRNQALLAGDLLKVMDMVSCLSAEKHAKLPCLTLMMDDLDVAETHITPGQVLNVKAKLTRPFGSSMEVVVDVAVKDIFKGEHKDICQAYFTYVAIAKMGKAKLARLYPVTMEERLEYALATERRRLRFVARNAAKVKSETRSKKPNPQQVNIANVNADQITMENTGTQSIELVLPSHANHHQSTFGGQVMAWLVTTCTISASKVCDTTPSIVAVNGIQFLGPSSVGDRLVFKSMVNKTFDDKTMEVGCCVEANSIGGETRHINSAYLTFICLDDQGKRKGLRDVVPTTTDHLQRQTSAASRRQALEEKGKILQHVGPVTSMPWTKESHDFLAMHNVSTIRKLSHQENWIEVSREGQTSLSKIREGENHIPCMKVETTLAVKAQHLFACLRGRDRAKWDPYVTETKLIQQVDDDDSIALYVLSIGDDKEKPLTRLLLESRRPPTEKQGDYIIAMGCISLKSLPPQPEYHRDNALLSGFVIEQDQSDPGTSHLTYIAQLHYDKVPKALDDEFSGKTKYFATRVKKLEEYAASVSL